MKYTVLANFSAYNDGWTLAETESHNRNSDAAFRTIPRRVSVFKEAKKYLNLFFSSTSAAYKLALS
jgi:hypothetical protein